LHAVHSPIALVAIGCAALSALISLYYLLGKPQLVRSTKVVLFFGLGVFPIAVAATGNVQGMEATKERQFCGSCHVMTLHAADSNDPASQTLGARHARNQLFGSENCYACHSDYGMYGTVLTKMGGMRHVYLYYSEYKDVPLEEAKTSIKLLKPYPNHNCTHCHSTENELWRKRPDHASSAQDTREGRMSCASAGCHGLAHPFFGPPDAGAPLQLSRADAGGVDASDAGAEGGR
jgi:nitrate/TMAO reductase-like tetraheme cytochrome c subunit